MLKSILGNFSVRFSSAIFNLLIAVLVSQFLGAAGKGEQSLILASITIVLLFHNLVSGASIIYLASRLNPQKLLIVSYLWTITVSFFSYLIIIKLAYFTPFISFAVVLLSTLSSFTAINSSLLIGREKIAKSNVVNFLVPFLTLSFLFVQFYFFENKSISAYFSALFFSYLLSLVCSLYFIKAYFFENETQDSKFQTTFKSLFYYGFQNQLAHIFQLLSFRISYFVIEHYNGKEAVGIYSNGISIAEAIWMITSSICLYQYSKISNSTDKEYSMRLTEKLTKVALFISFLVICVVAIIPTNFYTWIFGKEFYELKSLILLLLPGVWIYNYYLIIGHYFSGRGKFLSNALATFIGLVFTFLLIFSLVPKFGVLGSVLSAILSYLLTSLVAIIIYLCQGGKFVLFPNFSEIQNYLFTKTKVNEKSK